MNRVRSARIFLVSVVALLVVAPASPASSAAISKAGPEGIASGLPSDFNGDGWADMAAGAPSEDVGAATDTGGVNVIYGSATGLNSTNNQFWDETSTGTATNATGDEFGWAQATGDFNDDGFADLAVGAPFKNVGAATDAGAVSVLYGSPAGLISLTSQEWDQNDLGTDPAETHDEFGWALAAGDLNGDGVDDLAVSAAGEDVGTIPYAGSVNVLFGTAITGLSATGTQFWNQDSPGVRDSAAENDFFGISVAIGDFNGDSFGDLAIGVDGEKIGTAEDAGAVNVLFGSAAGPTEVDDQLWSQDSDGINDVAETGDLFGYVLATGDIDNDGFADLAVGVVLENIGKTDAGAVNVIYGSGTGLDSNGDEFWHQDRPGIKNVAEKDDEFGSAVTIGDFNGDGYGDLAVGVPFEDLTPVDTGAVNVIYGTSRGLDEAGDDFWKQDSTDIIDTSEAGDLFGYSVVAAEFGNGTEADLAIGVPLEDVGGFFDDGGVNVIYGSSSDLTAEGNQRWWQGSTDILDEPEASDWFGFGVAQAQAGAPGGAWAGRHVRAPR